MAAPSESVRNILIAGCGTGEHPFDVAQKSPHAQLLAIDLSRVSLAYARRKTREEGLRNIEYAQADILNLAGLDRRFDRIEALGVLHHLADPLAGWRILLGLLAPGGTMRVGLYSEAARRSIVEARALIAERGYPATAEGIRALRQTIIRERDEARWKPLVRTVDFYSMSGCRDIFFHVMEHRLTIPAIKSFLDENGLRFLGFEIDPSVTEKFRRDFRAQMLPSISITGTPSNGSPADIPEHVHFLHPPEMSRRGHRWYRRPCATGLIRPSATCRGVPSSAGRGWARGSAW